MNQEPINENEILLSMLDAAEQGQPADFKLMFDSLLQRRVNSAIDEFKHGHDQPEVESATEAELDEVYESIEEFAAGLDDDEINELLEYCEANGLDPDEVIFEYLSEASRTIDSEASTAAAKKLADQWKVQKSELERERGQKRNAAAQLRKDNKPETSTKSYKAKPQSDTDDDGIKTSGKARVTRSDGGKQTRISTVARTDQTGHTAKGAGAFNNGKPLTDDQIAAVRARRAARGVSEGTYADVVAANTKKKNLEKHNRLRSSHAVAKEKRKDHNELYDKEEGWYTRPSWMKKPQAVRNPSRLAALAHFHGRDIPNKD